MKLNLSEERLNMMYKHAVDVQELTKGIETKNMNHELSTAVEFSNYIMELVNQIRFSKYEFADNSEIKQHIRNYFKENGFNSEFEVEDIMDDITKIKRHGSEVIVKYKNGRKDVFEFILDSKIIFKK